MNHWLDSYRTALPWSDYQNQVFDDLQPGRNMLIEARAGSGKTTLLEGITAALLNQNSRYRVLLLAFNKHISEELKSRKRIPRRCEVRTSHSMGYKLLRGELPVLGKPDNLKIPRLIQSAISKMANASGDAPRLVLDGGYVSRQRRYEFVRNLKRLVDLARNNFVQTDEELDEIRQKYSFKSIRKEERYWLYRCCRWILKKDEQTAYKGEIDFGDMLYLPHIWNIKPEKYDFILVDELQDANLAQIKLYKSFVNAGATFIGVGDRHQAIYLFAGSCADSWTTLQFLIRCKKYQLPICYRCGTSILKYAKKLVDIKSAPFAIAGEVKEIGGDKVNQIVKSGDLILSRLNAPLISRCLSLVIQKRKAKVRGKNVAKYLIEFIERFIDFPTDFPNTWYVRMSDYCRKRIEHLKECGAELEARDFQDIYQSLDFLYRAFVLDEHIFDLEIFKGKILNLFDDTDTNCVILSTVHRAKGDEADTVFILHAGNLPMKPRKPNPVEKEQEENLVYVAITRAKKTLYFVDGEPDFDEEEEKNKKNKRD